MKKVSLALLLTSVLLLTLSCEKSLVEQTQPNPTTDSTALIAKARQFFDTKLAPQQPAARIAADDNDKWLKNKQPQWKQAVSFKIDGKDVVEVPLLFGGIDPTYTIEVTGLGNKGVIKKRNGVSKALFFKQQDGSIRAYQMRLILKPDYLAAVKQGGRHKQLSFNALPRDLSGFLLLYSWEDVLLDVYHYEGGKIVGSSRAKQTAGKGARVAGCRDVIGWRWVCVGAGGCCTEAEEVVDPTGFCCGDRTGVIDRNGANAYKHCEYEPYLTEECTIDHPVEPDPGPGGDDPGTGDEEDYTFDGNTDFEAQPGTALAVYRALLVQSSTAGGKYGLVNSTTSITLAWNLISTAQGSVVNSNGTVTDNKGNVYVKYEQTSTIPGFTLIGTISISSGPDAVKKIRFTII
jgi:hypothetical protein